MIALFRYETKNLIFVLVWIVLLTFLVPPLKSLSPLAQQSSSDDLIAFVGQVEKNWDLFIASTDGSNLQQLTETPYDEVDPTWSPDRSQIAYGSTDGVLRVINVQTNDIREFPPPRPRTRYIQPCFSPDGRSIAFAIHTTIGTDAVDIATINLESGHVRIVIEEPAIQLHPTWSTDPSVLFYIGVAGTREMGTITQDIWSVSLDTGALTRITDVNANCEAPSLSRDGTSLAFSSDQEGSYDLWRFQLKDSSFHQLTHSDIRETEPSWSGDGKTIAFTSNHEGRLMIFFLDIESGEIHEFNPFPGLRVQFKNPALSPAS